MSDGSLTPKRKVGSITADITIEEDHVDELVITEHPVEQGAAITDHAYKRPAQLRIRMAWSNASENAAGNSQYVREMYAKLLALQVSRELLDVETGKRSYSNMLIRTVGMTTDETTEYALFCTVSLQQVIIAATQKTTVPVGSSQADPQKTAPTVDNGTKQPVPVGPAVSG